MIIFPNKLIKYLALNLIWIKIIQILLSLIEIFAQIVKMIQIFKNIKKWCLKKSQKRKMKA